jgi:hypothetical protein
MWSWYIKKKVLKFTSRNSGKKTKRNLNQNIWTSLSRIEIPECRSKLLPLEPTYSVEVRDKVL